MDIGKRMVAMRGRYNLTAVELAKALGYRGRASSLQVIISRFEKGQRQPTEMVKRLILMYDTYGIPDQWRNGHVK